MSTLTTADAVASASPTQDSPRRVGIVPFGRRTAAAVIAISALCNTAEAVLSHYDGELGNDDVGDRLTAITHHHWLYLVATILGSVAALLMPLAFASIAHLVRPYRRRTATVAAVLGYFGGLAFLVIHVFSFVEIAASQQHDHAAATKLVENFENLPGMLAMFGPMFLGLFVGMFVLAAGVLRTSVIPKWIGAAMASFMALDLAGVSRGAVDAHFLWLAAAIGLATVIVRTPEHLWRRDIVVKG
jgi:Domain of unknown function (DUF4386)